MRPFKIIEPMADLQNPFPGALSLLRVARIGGKEARIALAQLWITEGIPFAFADCPVLYDSVRSWLGARLNVHAKEISITGSGRIGESLNPQNIGKPFSSTSDLDLFVVSGKLFNQFRDEFHRWAEDYERGDVRPRNKQEETYWRDNKARIPQNIRLGFIDAKKIPHMHRYQMSQITANCMWELVENLKFTSKGPKPARASVRVYADWDSLVKRVSYNLRSSAEATQ